MVPLCRLVAMPIVWLTLSSDLAWLEVDFVYDYQEGAVVFYLFTTNEGGLVDKVFDEDLQSWGPLWCAVNIGFEDYMSLSLSWGNWRVSNSQFVMAITKIKHGGMSSLAYILLILLGTTWLILLSWRLRASLEWWCWQCTALTNTSLLFIGIQLFFLWLTLYFC